ncbi:MAG: hypothetical protein AAGI45_01590 [Cyanobacteria bacterium P01_H01_bin.26]
MAQLDLPSLQTDEASTQLQASNSEELLHFLTNSVSNVMYGDKFMSDKVER